MVVAVLFANEVEACFMEEENALNDRKLFVKNLGALLSQTREGIAKCWLDDRELVHVQYRGGHEQLVNVNMDSYMSIVADVIRAIERGE